MVPMRSSSSSFRAGALRVYVAALVLTTMPCFSRAARAQEPQPQPQPQPRAANDRAFLGLQTEDAGKPGDGVRVVYVFPHSAAEEMGFRIGDRVIALNDVLIDDRVTFAREVGNNNIGGTLRFLFEREGESLKVNGKIGSYVKTMNAYQEDLRKEHAGKPLPKPPAAIWWNVESKEWDAGVDAESTTDGKLAVVFSIDDCPFCVGRKLPTMIQMQRILAQTSPDAPVAFKGYFYFEGKSPEESREAAAAVLEKNPVGFPVAVAYYPKDAEPERRKQALLHHHGAAIVGLDGKVTFLQIIGAPEQEFLAAYQKGLAALQAQADGAKEGNAPGQ